MRRLQDISELIGALALFAVMCIVFASVISRQVFGFIIPDAYDLSRMLLGILIFWGIAGAVAWKALITADFLYFALGRRGRLILDLVAAVVTFGVMALLTWRVWVTVIDAYGNGIRTQDVGIPLWYFYAVAGAAMPVAVLFVLRNALATLRGKDDDTESDEAAS